MLTANFARSFGGLKPDEILLVFMVSLLVIRRAALRDFTFVTTQIDAAFLVLLALGTFVPLITLEARGIYISLDTISALAGPVEYYLWYRVFLEAIPLPAKLSEILRIVLVRYCADRSHWHPAISSTSPACQTIIAQYYPGHNVVLSIMDHRSTSVLERMGIFGLDHGHRISGYQSTADEMGNASKVQRQWYDPIARSRRH